MTSDVHQAARTRILGRTFEPIQATSSHLRQPEGPSLSPDFCGISRHRYPRIFCNHQKVTEELLRLSRRHASL
jgi:hypothetical protein